uniref:Uncharacterized protein n=1 Tax=Quercus lobata TaxID=97700 RepID=A0A7N2LXZ0_QUELO
MVNRGSSHYRASLTSRFLPRKASPYAITLYIISLFAFSIFIFLFNTRNILEEDEQKPNFSGEFLSEQIPEEQLWDAPFSYGLQSCIKPTAKYKAAHGSDRYITVRSNGGLNQMRTGYAFVSAAM